MRSAASKRTAIYDLVKLGSSLAMRLAKFSRESLPRPSLSYALNVVRRAILFELKTRCNLSKQARALSANSGDSSACSASKSSSGFPTLICLAISAYISACETEPLQSWSMRSKK